uniref:Uncharacterized protein n=1 Tax=Vespula pensylvanica TaxID=30213 RepID=A0A834NWL3_VESPE|nr:hypothetical protein H0235_010177 [Vespula pensylvanica]
MHRPANNPSIGVVGDDDHVGSGRRSRGPRNTSYDFTSSLYHPVSLVPEVLDFVTVRFLRERGLDSARCRSLATSSYLPIICRILLGLVETRNVPLEKPFSHFFVRTPVNFSSYPCR